jgi:DNA modification methylase
MLERAEELATAWAYKTAELTDHDGLVLLDNVQFIYELALAELELNSLGVDFEITNSLRKFKVKGIENEERLRKRLAYFRSVNGLETDYFQLIQFNQTRSVNQYLTHWIYPYKGKFHPQMIRALLNCIGLEKGDTVLDPFVGSGTTALEAHLLGIDCVGVDVSPLCILQSKVKTESVDVLARIAELRERALGISSLGLGEDHDLERIIQSISDDKVRNFYSMAKLVSVSDNARRGKEFYKSFKENLQMMIRSVSDYAEAKRKLGLTRGSVHLETGDARRLRLEDDSIAGIVTSPPYSIALDYVENDEHSLKELGYDVNQIRAEFIGVRGSGRERVSLYDDDMRRSMAEMHRVLAPGKYAVIVVGNATYQGVEVETVDFTIKEAQKLGFKLVKNMDKIIFGLYNVMRKENILIFQKQ